MDYRAKLVDFYRKHNPLKLSEVDALLRKYKGREEELLQALRVKYKVNERDEPVDEPVKKIEEPIRMAPPPPIQEPPQPEEIKQEPLQPEKTYTRYADTDLTRSGDNKGRTAAERAEYWKKEVERREREKEKGREEKRTETKTPPRAEKMKVVRDTEDESESEVTKKPLNLKAILVIGISVFLLIAALVILLNENLRTSVAAGLGLSSEKTNTEEKAKKEGLDPAVLNDAGDSANKKNSGEFSLEEDEPDAKAPSVEDAMNEQAAVKKTVNADTETPSEPDKPATGVQRKKFYIGYAAVANEETAKSTAAELRRKGFDNAGYFYIPDYDPAGKNLYRIFIGPFSSIEAAEEMIVNVHSENSGAYAFFLK